MARAWVASRGTIVQDRRVKFCLVLVPRGRRGVEVGSSAGSRCGGTGAANTTAAHQAGVAGRGGGGVAGRGGGRVPRGGEAAAGRPRSGRGSNVARGEGKTGEAAPSTSDGHGPPPGAALGPGGRPGGRGAEGGGCARGRLRPRARGAGRRPERRGPPGAEREQRASGFYTFSVLYSARRGGPAYRHRGPPRRALYAAGPMLAVAPQR